MDEVIYKGIRFTKFGKYYRSARNDFLHMAIWKDHYGDIPEKHHIHHKNGNWDDNGIENLECILGTRHVSEHQKGHKRYPHAALAARKIWGETPEGKKFDR